MDDLKCFSKKNITEKITKFSITEDDENEEYLVTEVDLFKQFSRWRSYQIMMIMAINRFEQLLAPEETTVVQLSHVHEYDDKRITSNRVLELSTGKYVGRLFDTIAKESVMKRDSDEIALFVNLARTIRITREVAEANTRQIEATSRGEQDEIFKQVIKIHQDVATFFSDHLLEETIEQCANEDGLRLIKLNAKSMSRREDKCRDIAEGSSAEAAESTLDFIIPEANRILQREAEDTSFIQRDIA